MKLDVKNMLDITIVFQEHGVIDVTDFNAETNPIGYVRGCMISLYSDGRLQFITDDEKEEMLERFSIMSIIRFNDNMYNHHPDYSLTVRIDTENKGYDISFQSMEAKNRFCASFRNIYSALKK